jgi:hypothetical protein
LSPAAAIAAATAESAERFTARTVTSVAGDRFAIWIVAETLRGDRLAVGIAGMATFGRAGGRIAAVAARAAAAGASA